MWKRASFLGPELLVQRITLTAAVLSIVIALSRGARLDWAAYGGGVGLTGLMIAAGLFYRMSGRDDRIGTTLICAGHFILFTMMLSLFNYVLMPHWAPTLDTALARIDESLFGYRWPDFVAFSAAHPVLNEAMRFSYLSTLPQIAILVALLGLSGRQAHMHALMTTVVLSGTAAVVFWGIFPSLGPSALYDLPPDVLASARPVVGPDYGREIAALYQTGADWLSPDDIRGLIAFPSYHIVMALAVTWYARSLRYVLPVFVAINVFVLPGVLAHGGHHLVDIPAGIALFALVAWLVDADRVRLRIAARQTRDRAAG